MGLQNKQYTGNEEEDAHDQVLLQGWHLNGLQPTADHLQNEYLKPYIFLLVIS